jgi:hypothetical protein
MTSVATELAGWNLGLGTQPAIGPFGTAMFVLAWPANADAYGHATK